MRRPTPFPSTAWCAPATEQAAPPAGSTRTMGAREVAAGIGRLGPGTHATVAGAYAWATTVAPVAWAQGSGLASKVAASVAFLALAAGWLGSRDRGTRARIAALWAFVLSCAFAWSAAPAALAPLRFDPFRGVTGTLSWAVFAFAWAAPAFSSGSDEQDDPDDEPLVPRRRLAGREGYLLLGAGVLALAMQAVGWDVPGVERSLLVRFAALAAALALLDTAVHVALAQYPRRARASNRARLKAARPWLIALGILGAVGLAFAIKG
jgi:hypothetical protein